MPAVQCLGANPRTHESVSTAFFLRFPLTAAGERSPAHFAVSGQALADAAQPTICGILLIAHTPMLLDLERDLTFALRVRRESGPRKCVRAVNGHC